ncbi:MAG: hypothetical protein O2931_08415 [Planctomycetota bacterium]|nr:hypothetical protein [Planctomycetota bacterium]MDA1178803.1 hypothetical protein [Planctomycetota bacterium]
MARIDVVNMSIFWATMTRKAAISVTLLGACFTYGCGNGSKVQQIQRGAENVHRHAKNIEDAAGIPEGDTVENAGMQNPDP